MNRVRVLGVVMAVSLAACERTSVPPPEKAAAPPRPPALEVVKVVSQPLNATLSLPAELNAYQTVAVYPRVTGFVKSIAVDRGSRVRAGQLLVTLEAPEIGAQRAEFQSKLQSAQSQLASVRSKADADASTYDKLKRASATPGVVAGNDLVLAEKGVEADDGQVAAARQNVEAARQALRSVTEMEAYLHVTAPFDGTVTERNVHPGALVGPSGGPGAAPMLRVVQSNRLRLVVPVPEAYTAGITAGTEMPFSIAAYPGETFNGKVARIAQAVDVSTRTMAVELDVVNTDGRLAPGAFCQVSWPIRRSGSSLFVPGGSITSTTGRTFVIRVRDNRTEWVDVKSGVSAGALMEVVGRLDAGDQVAVRGTDEIRPGTEVRPTEVKPAGAR